MVHRENCSLGPSSVGVHSFKVGISFRELPHPWLHPPRGSLHQVAEQGADIFHPVWGILMGNMAAKFLAGLAGVFTSQLGVHFLSLAKPASTPSFHRCWFLMNTLHFKLQQSICSGDPKRWLMNWWSEKMETWLEIYFI